MLAIAGLTPPDEAGDDWWNGALPDAVLALTRAPGFEPPCTCLVADEAQDLARDSTLDVLDSLLVDGLAGARVVLSGDLASNIRQTPQLAELIEQPLDDELYIGFDRDAEDAPDELPLTVLRVRWRMRWHATTATRATERLVVLTSLDEIAERAPLRL
jgi:hypothetical protein